MSHINPYRNVTDHQCPASAGKGLLTLTIYVVIVLFLGWLLTGTR